MSGEIWRRGLTSRRWVALAAAVVSILPVVSGVAAAEGLSPQQQLAFDIYKELVEINTVTATGDTARAAEEMAARLRAAGFAEADVHAFSPAPRKGNLVARLRGTGARKPILLVAHLDVVPASPDDWSVDPFKLTEKDGYFYARGSGGARRHRKDRDRSGKESDPETLPRCEAATPNCRKHFALPDTPPAAMD